MALAPGAIREIGNGINQIANTLQQGRLAQIVEESRQNRWNQERKLESERYKDQQRINKEIRENQSNQAKQQSDFQKETLDFNKQRHADNLTDKKVTRLEVEISTRLGGLYDKAELIREKLASKEINEQQAQAMFGSLQQQKKDLVQEYANSPLLDQTRFRAWKPKEVAKSSAEKAPSNVLAQQPGSQKGKSASLPSASEMLNFDSDQNQMVAKQDLPRHLQPGLGRSARSSIANNPEKKLERNIYTTLKDMDKRTYTMLMQTLENPPSYVTSDKLTRSQQRKLSAEQREVRELYRRLSGNKDKVMMIASTYFDSPGQQLANN